MRNDLSGSDERVAVIARELDFGSHFRVFAGDDQSLALGDGSAVNRVDDDLDAVRVSHGGGAGENARVVLLSVEDAESVLELIVPAFIGGPPFRVFPVSISV